MNKPRRRRPALPTTPIVPGLRLPAAPDPTGEASTPTGSGTLAEHDPVAPKRPRRQSRFRF